MRNVRLASAALCLFHVGCAPIVAGALLGASGGGGGGGGASSPGTTTGPPTSPPLAPLGVQAQPFNSTKIRVLWNRASGATRYDVQRRDGGQFRTINVAPPEAREYFDGGRTPLQPHEYRIIARNDLGSSPPSAEVIAAAYDVPRVAFAAATSSAREESGSTTLTVNLLPQGGAEDEAVTADVVLLGTSSASVADHGVAATTSVTFASSPERYLDPTPFLSAGTTATLSALAVDSGPIAHHVVTITDDD